MVCFTQHIFRFPHSNFNNWVNLLCKYYPDVSVTVETNNQKSIEGRMTKKFFYTLHESEDYKITTDRFWAELGAIRTLPSYVKINSNDNNDNKIKKLSKAIDSMLQSRLSYDDCAIYICNTLDADNFDQLLDALKYIETKDITRQYISRNLQSIFLVLNDRHTIHMNTDNISDSTLPVFDVDDGFDSERPFGQELNGFFQTWSHKFKETNGDSWDEPIIQQN